ncbi:MAG: DUF1365 family protein [Alphaproteobacteria bacterium]|nr:DUF1365 family protein [Alphaproteobacteria bacterium]
MSAEETGTGERGPTSPCLYRGRVYHARLKPFRHEFRYRVFSLYLDLDGIPGLARRLRLFSHNRGNLLSFHDRDHGPRDGSPLRPWIEGALAARGLDLRGGRIGVLCFPRLFGYVFNPLTIYFCHRPGDGALAALVYEVKNTFGQQHAYVIPVTGAGRPEDEGRVVEQATDKRFYVSPFIDMNCRYRFRVRPPGDRLSVLIRQSDAEGEVLVASQTGKRQRLSDATVLRAVAMHPLMTHKVMAAIHWQALRLWLKGAKFHRKPAPPAEPVSG